MPKASPTPLRQGQAYSIHSVENALDLLEAICDQGGEARLTDLSQSLGLKKTSVFRLLATFENRGIVERGEDSTNYRLGLSAYEMGQKIISRMGILRKARPTMDRLARQCGEAVYFAVPRSDEILMLDMIDSPHQVKVVSLVGRRFALPSNAAGRIFLAYDEAVPGKAKGRARRLAIAPELAEELALIRQQGFCTDENGFEEAVACLAAPLFNGKGQVVASLAILGPSFRLTPDRVERELLPQLIDAGRGISTSLGYLKHYLRNRSES